MDKIYKEGFQAGLHWNEEEDIPYCFYSQKDKLNLWKQGFNDGCGLLVFN